MNIINFDNELISKLELNKDHELSAEDKRAYVDEQLDGIRRQLWRSRVDAMLNHRLQTTSKAEEIAVATKIEEHESNAKRYAEAISLLKELRDAL